MPDINAMPGILFMAGTPAANTGRNSLLDTNIRVNYLDQPDCCADQPAVIDRGVFPVTACAPRGRFISLRRVGQSGCRFNYLWVALYKLVHDRLLFIASSGSDVFNETECFLPGRMSK